MVSSFHLPFGTGSGTGYILRQARGVPGSFTEWIHTSTLRIVHSGNPGRGNAALGLVLAALVLVGNRTFFFTFKEYDLT